MSSSARPKKSYTRRFVWLGGAIVVVIALYTVGWFYVANLLVEKTGAIISDINRDGADLHCANADARGYPFRIGLFCSQTAFSDRAGQISVSAGALRSAAQIYRPTQIMTELDGPAHVALAGAPPLEFRWDLLRASARLAAPLPQRISLESSGLRMAKAEATSVLASSDSFEFHTRPNGRDLDLAARFGGLVVSPDVSGIRNLPPLAGLVDISAKDGVAFVLSGAEDPRGQAVDIRNLQLDLGEGAGLTVTGPASLDESGLLNADLTISLNNPEKLSAVLIAAFPDQGEQIASLMSGMAALGDSTSLPLRIVDGAATLGFVPVGNVPPYTPEAL